MLFPDTLVVLRGGGDLGTGAAWRLNRAGFPIVVCELSQPLAIRRAVAVASAISQGRVEIEGMVAEWVTDPSGAVSSARRGIVSVVESASLPEISPSVVVDARVAKRNVDTSLEDAPLVVALGPGFTAGTDCHAVVETMRGPHLGRVLWEGSAAPDTGVPGNLGGMSAERVVRAPARGSPVWQRQIGDLVGAGDTLGHIDGAEIVTTIGGVVRGLLGSEVVVDVGTKVADVDPRGDPAAAFEISDKALAVGGGVLEAVLTWLNR